MTSNKVLILISKTIGDIEQILPHPLQISSDWKVAVKDISIPIPLNHISDEETIILKRTDSTYYDPLIIKINNIIFRDTEDLIQKIHDIVQKSRHYNSKFYYNEISHKIRVKVFQQEIIEFTGILSKIFSLPKTISSTIKTGRRFISHLSYPTLDEVHRYLSKHQHDIYDHDKLYKDEIIVYKDKYYTRCKSITRNDEYYEENIPGEITVLPLDMKHKEKLVKRFESYILPDTIDQTYQHVFLAQFHQRDVLGFVKAQRVDNDYKVTKARPKRTIQDNFLFSTDYISNYMVDLRMDLWNLYIYTNICKPIILGDIYSPLLQTIPQENLDRDNRYLKHTYQYPIYLPVSGDFFSTIKLKICDEKGRVISIRHGKILITLEFIKTE